ncbi:MAG: hypothetical protein Q9181_000867 [Wetmoreana brouardii]
MAPVALESLQPELQTLIMQHIRSATSLKALLDASPRFYQVFLTCKEHLLSNLARQQYHPDVLGQACVAVKVSALPQTFATNRIRDKNKSSVVDKGYKQARAPMSVSISLCRFGTVLQWFVDDFWKESLQLLSQLGRSMGLRQDLQVLESPRSSVETGRIQRAFCRFETLRCLMIAPVDAETRDLLIRYHQGIAYLASFREDEVEEIACIRDYLVRRLWRIFEGIEKHALSAEHSDAVREMGRAFNSYDWFSSRAKRHHLDYMEHLMTFGLVSLRRLFESNTIEQAGWVISNSFIREMSITAVLQHANAPSSYGLDAFEGPTYADKQDFTDNDIHGYSCGWLYSHHGYIARSFNRWPLKGLRDWGYCFWSKHRLKATGVLSKE